MLGANQIGQRSGKTFPCQGVQRRFLILQLFGKRGEKCRILRERFGTQSLRNLMQGGGAFVRAVDDSVCPEERGLSELLHSAQPVSQFGQVFDENNAKKEWECPELCTVEFFLSLCLFQKPNHRIVRD